MGGIPLKAECRPPNPLEPNGSAANPNPAGIFRVRGSRSRRDSLGVGIDAVRDKIGTRSGRAGRGGFRAIDHLTNSMCN